MSLNFLRNIFYIFFLYSIYNVQFCFPNFCIFKIFRLFVCIYLLGLVSALCLLHQIISVALHAHRGTFFSVTVWLPSARVTYLIGEFGIEQDPAFVLLLGASLATGNVLSHLQLLATDFMGQVPCGEHVGIQCYLWKGCR